jgi:hypothetical protein
MVKLDHLTEERWVPLQAAAFEPTLSAPRRAADGIPVARGSHGRPYTFGHWIGFVVLWNVLDYLRIRWAAMREPSIRPNPRSEWWPACTATAVTLLAIAAAGVVVFRAGRSIYGLSSTLVLWAVAWGCRPSICFSASSMRCRSTGSCKDVTSR